MSSDREIAAAKIDAAHNAIGLLHFELTTTADPVVRKRLQGQIQLQEQKIEHMQLHLPKQYNRTRRRHSDRYARRVR